MARMLPLSQLSGSGLLGTPAVVVWGTVSRFFQVTVVPTGMVRPRCVKLLMSRVTGVGVGVGVELGVGGIGVAVAGTEPDVGEAAAITVGCGVGVEVGGTDVEVGSGGVGVGVAIAVTGVGVGVGGTGVGLAMAWPAGNTETVACINVGWNRQKYGNVPTSVNVKEKAPAGAIGLLSQKPVNAPGAPEVDV